MSTSKTEVRKVNRDVVLTVGAHVMAMQLTTLDPARIDDHHFDLLADMSVRAALALDAAIPRAEERLAAEAKAADDAKAAQDAADKAAHAAADKAAAEAAADQKDADKAAAKDARAAAHR